ncbi:unnamed protein product [Dibothriocephalus latus]|uniref:Uncharacterized protein n=1 Tax=Dibothriocephalus latus TaxID=60516 RepID=A0A3P6SVZ6_DIBLA|nr:unnamed protein product [Dibothriocephalus latus]
METSSELETPLDAETTLSSPGRWKLTEIVLSKKYDPFLHKWLRVIHILLHLCLMCEAAFLLALAHNLQYGANAGILRTFVEVFLPSAPARKYVSFLASIITIGVILMIFFLFGVIIFCFGYKKILKILPRMAVAYMQENLVTYSNQYSDKNLLAVEVWDFAKADDAWKLRLLPRKLCTKQHDRYMNMILKRNPRDFTFNETVHRLSEMFSDKSCLFIIPYQCLNLVKNETGDFLTLVSAVNRECQRFHIRELTNDQFKCLFCVSALQSPRDAEIRTRLLSKIEQDPKSTLQTLTAKCQRLKHI